MGKREEFFDRQIKSAATTEIKDRVADGVSDAADVLGEAIGRGADMLLPGGSTRARARAEAASEAKGNKQTASGAWDWANKPLYDTGNAYGNIATSPVGVAGGLTAAAALYWLLKKRRRQAAKR